MIILLNFIVFVGQTWVKWQWNLDEKRGNHHPVKPLQWITFPNFPSLSCLWLPNSQALTSTRYPTRPELFFTTRTWPQIFSEFRVFPSRLFPAGRFKSFNNNPRILIFISQPEMKSSVSKVKCRRYKKWIQGKSGIWQFIDDAFWFYSSWGNQINQSKNHNLLSEAYGLKKPQVTPHHHEVLHLLRIQLGPFGGDQWSLTMTTFAQI